MDSSAAEIPSRQPDLPSRRVGRLIKQVFSSLLRGVDKRMQPLDLTAMQWEPLLLLLHLGRADTVAALAREGNANCSATTRLLDRLEEKGLVTRQRSDVDRRVVHLGLTEKGLEVGDAIEPLVNAELNGHLRGFTETEVATLLELLGRMLRNGQHEA